MTPAALMADLEARGVRLMAVGQTLRVDAPRGVLTTADREALLAHKAAVLAALRAEASRASTPTPAPARGRSEGSEERAGGHRGSAHAPVRAVHHDDVGMARRLARARHGPMALRHLRGPTRRRLLPRCTPS